MRDDGESTPFLRGRAAAGELYGAAAGTCRQAPPREDQLDGPARFFSREQQPVWSSSRARWRQALLAVTSVGAAVLVIAVVLIMSISRQAGSSPQDGGASLAAAAPREIIAAGGRGAGSDEGPGSKGPGGGWRPHANRSPGDDARRMFPLSSGYARVLFTGVQVFPVDGRGLLRTCPLSVVQVVGGEYTVSCR